MIATWVLVLFVAPSGLTSVAGFHSESACAAAGEAWIADSGHWYSRGRGWTCIEVK